MLLIPDEEDIVVVYVEPPLFLGVIEKEYAVQLVRVSVTNMGSVP